MRKRFGLRFAENSDVQNIERFWKSLHRLMEELRSARSNFFAETRPIAQKIADRKARFDVVDFREDTLKTCMWANKAIMDIADRIKILMNEVKRRS